MKNLEFFQRVTDTLWGGFAFQTLFYLGILLIILLENKRNQKVGVAWYSVCVLLVIYNPILYHICKLFFSEQGMLAYYCRLFCLIPIVFVISYAFVLVLRQTTGWKKFCCVLFVMFVVSISGNSIYQEDWFVKAQNVNKVPEDVRQLSALFEEYEEPVKIIAPTELVPYIRQIDSKFSLLHGRGEDTTAGNQLQSEKPDVQMLLSYAKSTGYDYLIAFYNEDTLKEYLQWGCEVVGYTDRYVVLKQHYPKWVLKQYADDSGQQGMFYTLKNVDDGALIVINGGNQENEEQVRRVIEEEGGVVTAWVLTNYNPDRIGAFNAIYQEPQGIVINLIYTAPYNEELFISAFESQDEIETFETFVEATKEDDRVQYIRRDFVFGYKDMCVTFLNCFDAQFLEYEPDDILNNASLVFKVETRESSILFCGDCYGNQMADLLIERYGEDLHADYVQFGYCGNNSLPIRFYDVVQPGAVLFDAPEWLMLEEYDTKKLADYFQKQEIKYYDYTTAPNWILLY